MRHNDAISMIAIKAASPKTLAIRGMIDQLNEYQLALYPAESNHLVSIAELAAPQVYFVAAYEGRRVLGCGAVKYAEDDCFYGEIKRVFVKIKARGRGVSKQIMASLEADARGKKAQVLRLETGIHQHAAIGLYAHFGFSRRGPFGEYAEDPLSVFMEKSLEIAQ